MSESPRLLVLGANGRTGRAVLAAAARRGVTTRAFVRQAAQAEALRALGANDVAVGDFADGASIERAAQGCRSVLYIGPPMHPDELQMASAAHAAAQQARCEHFIYYSVLLPVLREIRHHRLKLEAEERIALGNLPWTIVQPARYMQHLEALLPQIRRDGVHAMPFGVEARFDVVDLHDVAEVVARIASEDGHLYATYALAGPESLDQRDMARILERVLGRTVRAEALPIATMQERARRAGASEDRIAQMTSMNRHYDAHGLRGNPRVLTALLGRPPTSYEQYVRRVVAAPAV